MNPECHLISYDHGGLVLWGSDHFISHLRNTVEWLERHPRLKMGLDNEAWAYDWLAANQPAVLDEIRSSLARFPGRLAIGTCTYGQPLAAFLLEESNLRQITLGTATTLEHLGRDVRIYSFSEHAAFAQLPQILNGLGFEGVLLRTHFLMYGYCPGYNVSIAWWRGPDGSQIACVPAYQGQERPEPGYSAEPPGPFGLTTEDNWILTRWPGESRTSLDDFCKRFAGIRPLLASRIDDSGLKKEELVRMVDDRPEFEWMTLEDVFARFPKPTQTISPGSEDFRVRMPWGYGGNELFDLSRQAEIAVMTAERLLARTATGGPAASGEFKPLDLPSHTARLQQIAQAWKDLLVGQHHDIQITQRAAPMGRQRLHASLERSRDVIHGVLSAQADSAQVPEDFIAFNPLPWPREEAEAISPDGHALPGPVNAPALGLSPFHAKPLAFTPVPPRPESPLTFSTDAYEVTFDSDGGLSKLTASDGTPILREGAVSGRLAGVIDGVACEGAGAATLARGSAGWQVTERGQIGALAYTIRWLFPQRGARIDYHVMVRFDGEMVGAPTTRRDDRSCFIHEQKLRVRFFPAVDPARATGIYDVPFGVATTDRPYVEGNYWTALGDEHGGLALANRGTMGNVREEDGAFSVPLAFSTHYWWGRKVICGNRQWSLGLLPWRGDWRRAGLHRRALEFAFPMVAVPGTLRDSTGDYLPLDNPDINLTALYLEGGHAYARFFNGAEESRRFTLPKAMMSVDLRHRDQRFRGPEVTLEPCEILTVRIS